MKYLFTIFHRLNTGGNKLTNQEIRNCIYHGTFNKLTKELVKYDNFRTLLSLDKKKSYRFIYEELILRIFAFNEKLDKYKGRLANFLNDYMEKNKRTNATQIEIKRDKFQRAVDLTFVKIMEGQPFPKTNKTTIEGILVGVINNIDAIEDLPKSTLKFFL